MAPRAADAGDGIEMAVKVELAVDQCAQREAFYDLNPSRSLAVRAEIQTPVHKPRDCGQR